MNLRVKRVSAKSEYYQKVKKLYQEAFPKNEKFPMWLLLSMGIRKCVDFYAFFDNETFCGLSYLIHHEKITFVLYLATDETLRSKGYGAGILEWISNNYPQTEIVLNIETISEECGNLEQRIKRQGFYLKNRFQDTGYTLTDRGQVFDVLSTSSDFSADRYERLFKRFSFGLVTFDVTKKY